MAASFDIPTSNVEGCPFLQNPAHTCLFYYYHPGGCEGASRCAFHSHFLNGQGCPVPLCVLIGHSDTHCVKLEPCYTVLLKAWSTPLTYRHTPAQLHPPRPYQKCKSRALPQLTRTRNCGSGPRNLCLRSSTRDSEPG